MAAVREAKPAPSQVGYYPESDGQPMADNTKQFQWIVTIKENLDVLLTNAFVAGDLFWYPLEGNNMIKQAPDVLVALGRPKGHRGSYRQWEEDNLAPQIVFEILSPGNRVMEMLKKEQFYERYGVAEYYVYDPDDNELVGWWREAGQWQRIDEVHGWISPLLCVRFELTPPAYQFVVVRVIDIIFRYPVPVVELLLLQHLHHAVAWRKNFKDDLRGDVVLFPLSVGAAVALRTPRRHQHIRGLPDAIAAFQGIPEQITRHKRIGQQGIQVLFDGDNPLELLGIFCHGLSVALRIISSL